MVFVAVGGMAVAQPSLQVGFSPPARAPESEIVAFPQIPFVTAFLNFLLGSHKSGDNASGENDILSDTGFGRPQESSLLPMGRKPVVPLPRAFPSVETEPVVPGAAASRRNAVAMAPHSAGPVAVIPLGRAFGPNERLPMEEPVSATVVAVIESTLPKPRPEEIRKIPVD